MKLDAYLYRKRLKQSDFARSLGVSQATISNLINGSRWISRDMARKIADATRGMVTANDFVDLNPERDAA